jgi:hypothetical protein
MEHLTSPQSMHQCESERIVVEAEIATAFERVRVLARCQVHHPNSQVSSIFRRASLKAPPQSCHERGQQHEQIRHFGIFAN